MKISKLFHWLYATLMFLPLIALPIFGIYSHRHTIDSGTIQVPQNQIVDFNQLVKNGNFENSNYWSVSGGNLTIDNNQSEIEVEVTSGYYWTSLYQSTTALNYTDKFLISVDLYQNTSGTMRVVFNTNVDTLEGDNFITTYGTYQNLQFIFDNPDSLDYVMFQVVKIGNDGDIYRVRNFQCFNLTQMFGSGNEPSIQQFNTWYTQSYYSYTLSRKELLKDTFTITYSDTDIMSQFTYQIYNLESKYLNFDSVFGFGNVYDWLQLNIFNGNPSIYFTMFWHLLTYWLIVSLFWLVFDVLMYVPQLAHRWLDRGAIE